MLQVLIKGLFSCAGLNAAPEIKAALHHPPAPPQGQRDERSAAFNSLYLHVNVRQRRVCLFLNEERVIMAAEQSGPRPQESGPFSERALRSSRPSESLCFIMESEL